MEWRSVNIYYGDDGRIILIPVRYCPEAGMVDAEPYVICTADNVDEFYRNLIDTYEITATGIEQKPVPSALEQATNIRDWDRAIRKLNLLNFQWTDAEGFLLILNKRYRSGFAGYKKIHLGPTLNKDEICKRILEIIKVKKMT
jgi:hypothetical protein